MSGRFTVTLLVIVGAVGLGGCGTGGLGAGPSASSSPTGDASVSTAPVAAGVRRVAVDASFDGPGSLWQELPEAGVLYAAPLVVVAEVTEVLGPFWNTADGQKWAMVRAPIAEGGDYTVPVMYREVTVRVLETVRDDGGLGGEEVTFIALGGGEKAQGEDRFIGGEFESGARYVLFLAPSVLYMRERPLQVLMPFYNHLGVYPIDESTDRIEYKGDEKEVVDLALFLAHAASTRAAPNPTWEPYRVEIGDVQAEIDTALKAIQTGDVDPPDTTA